MTLADAQREKYGRLAARHGHRSRRPRPRDRLGLGRLRRRTRAHDRVPGHDDHRLEGTTRARGEAGGRPGPRRQGPGPTAGLPAHARALRPRRVRRDDGVDPAVAVATRTSGSSTTSTAPGGTVGLQLITVADHHWNESDRNPDFIRRYIFPGGQVPSMSVLRGLASDARPAMAPRRRVRRFVVRTHARQRGCESFDDRWPQIRDLGFDERFRRMWRYYLAYCRAGFAMGRVDVSQIVLTRA